MKSMRKISAFICVAGAILIASCQSNKQGAGAQNSPLALPVVEVEEKTVTGFTAYPASLEGAVTSAVRAKVAGYITKVLVDEGQKVKKGQPLFRLETQTLSQDAEAAEANVKAALVEVNRLKPLVERGIVSEVQLKTAEARLAQAQAAYKGIVANIEYATIKSPIDGYVGSINFREGALVSPGDPTPLTTVSDVDKIYAFFSMNERDYLDFIQNTESENLSDKIANFPPVRLRLVNDSLYREEGKIETVTGQIDPSTGSVKFRATFPNPNRLLASGNSGKILVPKTYENRPVVPEAATFERQGTLYVYLAQGDSLAVSTPIKALDRINNMVVVGSGVEAGQKIVAEGVAKLRDNTPIAPQHVELSSVVKRDVVFR